MRGGPSQQQGRAGRRGGAMVLALIAATSVAVLTATILQLSAHFTRKQLRAEQDTRAFYIAEAGLSEAYYSLTSGGSGAIGSMENPARSGDGLLWVESTLEGDGRIRLQSTALSGRGRSSLAVTVERSELPLGIFANEDIVVASPILVDGYDSQEQTYDEQAKLDIDGIYGYFLRSFYEPSGLSMELGALVQNAGHYYRIVSIDEERVWAYDLGTEYVEPENNTSDAVLDELLATPHTSGGATLSSNGSITFKAPGAVYGEIVAGPEGEVLLHEETVLDGLAHSRSERVELEPVVAPVIPLVAEFEHAGPIPLVISAGQAGYETLRVMPGSELVLRGPTQLLVGSLDLREDSLLDIDNLAGRVDLYVIDKFDFAPGSDIRVASTDPSQLTLQVVGGSEPLRLASSSSFHGVIYAPLATLSIEEPFELFGTLACNSLLLGSGVVLHFDSGYLDGDAPVQMPRLVSWESMDVPAAVRMNSAESQRMMSLDPGELSSAQDAAVSYSWQADVRYRDKSGSTKEYHGPYEYFDSGDVGMYFSFQLVEPDYATAEPWIMRLDYLDYFNQPKTWEGDVATFTGMGIKTVLARLMTPPQELRDLGIEPVTMTFEGP